MSNLTLEEQRKLLEASEVVTPEVGIALSQSLQDPPGPRYLKALADAGAAYAEIARDQGELDGVTQYLSCAARWATQRPQFGVGVEVAKKRVYLCLPRLWVVELGVAKAAFVTPTANRLALRIKDQMTSLLAHGFNCGLVEALDEGFDVFAILHADLVPVQDCWLDILVDSLNRCDVVHAPAAIKDGRNLTSTGLGNLAREWDCQRKLSVAEVLSMPEEFGLDECLQNLSGAVPLVPAFLPNTGCFAMKLGSWCEEWSGFEIRDRIVKRDGRRVAECISEDWGLGYHCAREGLRVLANRRVTTYHYAPMYYPSDQPLTGGWKQDEHYLKWRASRG